MEILLWWVPALVVTVLAMLWVAWLSREGRGEVDREESLERLARALSRERPTPSTPQARERDRSTGIAVRRARSVQPPTRSTRPGP